jgi:hypothetical protein
MPWFYFMLDKHLQPFLAYTSVMTTNSSPIVQPMAVALRRLELCAYAVQEIHTEVDQPQDSEHKADLLLATENLVYEVLDLLRTVKGYAWGPEDPDAHSHNEDDDDY